MELQSGREKPGRFWKIDLDAIDYGVLRPAAPAPPRIRAPHHSKAFACDLREAGARHRALVARAFGSVLDPERVKFAALATALWNTGTFVFVPAGVALDEPIEIEYEAGPAPLFPYTLVLAEAGSRCTVVERVTGSTGTFVCGAAEIACAENAQVAYAYSQELPEDACAFFTRAAAPGRGATISLCAAELGAQLSVSSIDVAVREPGAEADIAGLFFPSQHQHVDLQSTVRHLAGSSQSQTLIKSAAIGSGQGRYLGTITIAPHAQATQAALRDDALLLSKGAHIDSVPALEIGANDVKAFHGATVGAIDEEQIFYMTSRGIEPDAAERMIALGFFEPALARFPTEALRARLRAALEMKLSP